MQFIKSAFSKSDEKPSEPKVNYFHILVIDGNQQRDWAGIFKNFTILDKEIKVTQAGWDSINLASYSEHGKNMNSACYVDVFGKTKVTISFDFVLVRSQVKGATPDQDWTNLLYGLKYANIPSVNSLESIYNFIERPWVFSELIKIRDRIGRDKFPLISQNYYPNHREMIIGPQFPAVVKVGHAHAGYGKMKIRDHHDFEDFASVMALTKSYVTGEPFFDGEFDLRVQKIGKNYRVFKRISMGNWKTNTGTSIVEVVEVTDRHKLWVDEASKMFGGLDILAVDVIHTVDGKEYILEVNDTAIGLAPDFELEDMKQIRDLVIEKAIQVYSPK